MWCGLGYCPVADWCGLGYCPVTDWCGLGYCPVADWYGLGYCPVADCCITAGKRDGRLPQNRRNAWSAIGFRWSKDSFIVWYSFIVVRELTVTDIITCLWRRCWKFDICLSVHRWYKYYRQPTRCNNSGLLIIPISSALFGRIFCPCSVALDSVLQLVQCTRSCNTQSSAPEDGQNNCPKRAELTGIINNPLLLHLVDCLLFIRCWKFVLLCFGWDVYYHLPCCDTVKCGIT